MSTEEEIPSGEETPVQTFPSAPAEEATVNFYVTNAAGELVRDGQCIQSMMELQAFNEGETVHRGVPSIPEAAPAVLTHIGPRQQLYPSLADQLDVIWKILAKNPDALGEEGVEMLGRITATKEAYPKGVLYTPNMSSEETTVQYVPVEQTNQ